VKSSRTRVLAAVGLVLMVLGALDPLEGSVVILAGSAVAVMAAWFGASPRYPLQTAGFVLVAVGVAALFGLSAIGGVGDGSGRTSWWLLLCLPYPVGWLMGLVGAARQLRETHNPAA